MYKTEGRALMLACRVYAGECTQSVDQAYDVQSSGYNIWSLLYLSNRTACLTV